MKYKVGDKLYCHTERLFGFNNIVLTTVDNFYEILEIKTFEDKYYIIKSNTDINMVFTYTTVEEYFYSLKKIRLMKLDRLCI